MKFLIFEVLFLLSQICQAQCNIELNNLLLEKNWEVTPEGRLQNLNKWYCQFTCESDSEKLQDYCATYSSSVSSTTLCTEKVECHDACLECWDTKQTTCFSCKKGYELNDYTCYPKCSYGCIKCNQTVNSSICSECSTSSTLLSNGFCLPICDPSCKNCSGWEPIQCTECWPNFKLSSGQCVRACPDTCSSCNLENSVCQACIHGYILSAEGKCLPKCFNFCDTCSGPQPNQCLTCKDEFNLKDGVCEPTCHESCAKCVGTKENQCSECKQFYQLQAGKCVLFCQEPCKTCQEKPTTCTSCISDDYTFDEETNLCTYSGNCHSSCKTCSGSKHYQCLTCNSGYNPQTGGYCISETDCGTYFEEIIPNFGLSIIDQTETDELFNISLQVYPKINFEKKCIILDINAIKQNKKTSLNYIIDNFDSAHYLGLILNKKDLIELSSNHSQKIHEKYTCQFEVNIYLSNETSQNSTSFNFEYYFQKDLISNEFLSFVKQPVEKYAPYKNTTFKNRIVSEMMICENCNCSSRKSHSIKVNEPIYLKQYLVDPDLYEKYTLTQNKIFINTSYGEIQDFLADKKQFCNSWILTDYGNRTQKINVKECKNICYEKGSSLLKENCSLSLEQYVPNKTVCICSQAFDEQSMNNKIRMGKIQENSQECKNWDLTELGHLLGQQKEFCQASCYHKGKFSLNKHCVLKSEQKTENTICLCDQIVCSSNCKKCVGTSSKQCLECYEGYLLANGSCVAQCPLGCTACSLNSAFSCSQCSANYELVNSRYCAFVCPGNCLSCTNETCLLCKKNYLLTTTGTCKLNCSTGCSICDENDGCTVCTSGYTLDNGHCKKDSGCHADCSTCIGPAIDECFSCPSSKQLVQGRCVTYTLANINQFLTDLEIIPHVEDYSRFGYQQQISIQFSKPYLPENIALDIKITVSQTHTLQYYQITNEKSTSLSVIFSYKDIDTWECPTSGLSYKCEFQISFMNSSSSAIKQYQFQFVYQIDLKKGYAIGFASKVVINPTTFTEQIKFCSSWKSQKIVTQRYCQEKCQDSIFKVLSNKCSLESTTESSTILCTCSELSDTLSKKSYYKNCNNWQPTVRGILRNITIDDCYHFCYDDQNLNSLNIHCAGSDDEYIEETTLCECAPQVSLTQNNEEEKYCAETVGKGYTLFKGTFKSIDLNGSTIQAESFIESSSRLRILDVDIYEKEIVITNETDIKIVSPETEESNDDDDNNGAIIAVIVVCSVVGFAIFIILLILCLKKKKRQQVDQAKKPDSSKKPLKLNEEPQQASVGNKQWK